MVLPDITCPDGHNGSESGQCCLLSHHEVHDVAPDPARESHHERGHRDVHSPPFDHSLSDADRSGCPTIYGMELYCSYSDATAVGGRVCIHPHYRHGSRQTCAFCGDQDGQPSWATIDSSVEFDGSEPLDGHDAGHTQRGPKRKQIYLWQCCQCGQGRISIRLDDCYNCGIARCAYCPVSKVRV